MIFSRLIRLAWGELGDPPYKNIGVMLCLSFVTAVSMVLASLLLNLGSFAQERITGNIPDIVKVEIVRFSLGPINLEPGIDPAVLKKLASIPGVSSVYRQGRLTRPSSLGASYAGQNFYSDILVEAVDGAFIEKYFNKGQMYKARNMYLKALAQDPRNIGILNNLAFIYHVLGDDATSKGYNEILLKECDEILKQGAVKEILILKIPALVSLERTNEVMEVIEEILKIDSKDLNALFQKSYYLEKNKRHEEALDCIEQILKKHPYHIGTLLSKGRNLVELNRFEEAEKCYNLVFEIEPKNKAAINLKSQLLKRKYNLTLTSHDLMLKAVESFEMENFKASRDYFKKALDMSSEFDEIWFAQGELFIRTGHINDAIASFKKAFEINPTSGGIIKHKEFFRLLDRMKKINTFLGFEKKG